jgi:hypothetical protein
LNYHFRRPLAHWIANKIPDLHYQFPIYQSAKLYDVWINHEVFETSFMKSRNTRFCHSTGPTRYTRSISHTRLPYLIRLPVPYPRYCDDDQSAFWTRVWISRDVQKARLRTLSMLICSRQKLPQMMPWKKFWDDSSFRTLYKTDPPSRVKISNWFEMRTFSALFSVKWIG